MTTSSAESIFVAALEKANPAERTAYLDQACHGDSDLRRQVERLLEAHPQVGSFLQQPMAENLALASGDRAAGAGVCPDRDQPDPGRTSRQRRRPGPRLPD